MSDLPDFDYIFDEVVKECHLEVNFQAGLCRRMVLIFYGGSSEVPNIMHGINPAIYWEIAKLLYYLQQRNLCSSHRQHLYLLLFGHTYHPLYSEAYSWFKQKFGVGLARVEWYDWSSAQAYQGYIYPDPIKREF